MLFFLNTLTIPVFVTTKIESVSHPSTQAQTSGICFQVRRLFNVDPCHTEFVLGKNKISFAVSLISQHEAQVIEIVSRRRQWPVYPIYLTHWGQVTHIGVNKLTITGSDNGLSPDRRQAIIWTNAGILLIRTLGTNFSEIESEIDAFLSKEMHLKMSSGKWRPFCLVLNVSTP